MWYRIFLVSVSYSRALICQQVRDVIFLGWRLRSSNRSVQFVFMCLSQECASGTDSKRRWARGTRESTHRPISAHLSSSRSTQSHPFREPSRRSLSDVSVRSSGTESKSRDTEAVQLRLEGFFFFWKLVKLFEILHYMCWTVAMRMTHLHPSHSFVAHSFVKEILVSRTIWQLLRRTMIEPRQDLKARILRGHLILFCGTGFAVMLLYCKHYFTPDKCGKLI